MMKLSPARLKRTIPLLVLLLIVTNALVVIAVLQSAVSINSFGTVSSSSTQVSWLHTSGTEVYDESNNVTRLYLTTIHDGNGFKLKQSDFQNIANMGFKGVRFFIYWGQCQPSPTTITTAYFSSGTGEPGGNAIDNIVNWCRDAGLYVLLCPGWSSYWTPPTWAQTSTGLTVADGGPHVDMLNDATIQSGIQYLYSFLAQRYASYPNVMFESFNELQSASRPCSTAEYQQWEAFNNMWLSAIEANEGATSHIKVVQLFYDWNANTNYAMKTPFFTGAHSNIIMAVHSYPLAKTPSSTALAMGQAWSNLVRGQNLPIMDTEGSAYQGGSLSQWASYCNQCNFVGWGYFLFDAANNADNGANVNNPSNQAAILSVLQPYMLAY
jgi:hypothetical protein